MRNNTISIVITCFSEGHLLFDAVSSVKNQSLLPLEIIVVNDASTDSSTIEVCKKLEQQYQIQVIWRDQNGGPSAARNNGFAAATGDILVPLDADDILPHNALELVSKTFQKHPDAGFVYGNYLKQEQTNSRGKIINPGDISLLTMLKAKNFSLSTNWKLLGTTPLRRSLWQTIGGYDQNFSVEDLHDVEFWIRAIASGCSYYYIPDVIYIWRKYLGSNSRRVTPLSWYRIAQKYFSIYQEIGLEYRAYELLLLGSKWLNHAEEIVIYSKEIKRCIASGQFQLSTLITAGISTNNLQFLAQLAQKKR